MRLTSKMFAEFPKAVDKYRQLLSLRTGANLFGVIQYLAMKPDPHAPMNTRTNHPSAQESMDLERLAAILVAVEWIDGITDHQLSSGHSADGTRTGEISLYYRFIESVNRTFFDTTALLNTLESEREAIKDFFMAVLGQNLTLFMNQCLFDEQLADTEFAMTDEEWAGFKMFISFVCRATEYVPSGEQSFCVITFSNRFGSMVSFRNEKLRRLRQINMLNEIEQIKNDLKQLHANHVVESSMASLRADAIFEHTEKLSQALGKKAKKVKKSKKIQNKKN